MGQILMPCCTYGSAELDSITATASDIREGKTSVDQDGEIVNGALADKKNWSSDNLSAGTSITIPAGIHNGSGKVTAKSLADQTQGTAVAANILKNKTAVVNGTKITGTMADIASVDPAKSVVLYNNNLYVRMTNGAHITNTTAGYPEVSVSQASLASAIGLTAAKLLRGQTVAGVTGTGRQKVKQLGDECFYDFGNSDDGSSRGPYDQSFTLPSDGVVYYSGGSASYSSRKTVTCEIYKNGSIVDSRNIDSSNDYVYRGTMTNKSFTVKKGDVIRVRVGTTASSHSTAFLFATIVYD